MSFEVKLGDLNMGLFGRKKKNKDEHSGDEMSRREFLKKTGIAAAGAYLGANVFGGSEAGGNPAKIPGAIMADPDNGVYATWDVLKNRYRDDHFSLGTGETVLTMLRIRKGDTTRTKVDFITPKTSHAYYLLAAKLNRCSDFLIEKNLKENVSLNMFANGLKNMFGMTEHDRNNYRAAEFFAKGIFTAGMYDKSNSEAFERASEFMSKDVRGKELMLREIYENKFKKFDANPQSRNVKSVEYKMLSFYWNLGFYIFTGYIIPDHSAIGLYDNKDSTYHKLKDKFGYATCTKKLIK